MQKYFDVGKIINTHGIKGEVKVFPMTDEIRRFDLLKTVCIEFEGELKKFVIERVRYNKNVVILKLEGFDSINDSEVLKGSLVKIPKDDALPLDDDEYYISDIYDMDVFDEGERYVGRVIDIISTGANDVYVVKSGEYKKNILLPAIKQCILNVDLKRKKMTVKLLDGLLEL